ncbi:MAG: 3-dehydroquinate synthase [Bacteroidales bacterium]|nr:3-dehydroquinate synthase [Bacteroidales bacterium]
MKKAFNRNRIETGAKITDAIPLLEDCKTIFILCDKSVEKFAKQIKATATLAINGGETAKNLATIEKIALWLMENKAGRDAFLLIAGGGSVSDAGAFAASIYKRGIKFAIIPTTLLAQVDAGIGGKNAVNIGGIKNILGTFRMPEFTYICPEVLSTLPEEEFLSGSAELLKTLIISGSENYSGAVQALAAAQTATMEERIAALNPLILEAARFKAQIAEADPFDKGRRGILNLGHTFGHAIEAATGLSHGKSVAIGIILAAQLSEKVGLAKKDFADKLKADFSAIGLPTETPVPLATLQKYMIQDKKADGDRIRFMLPVDIGITTEVFLSAGEAVNLLDK